MKPDASESLPVSGVQAIKTPEERMREACLRRMFGEGAVEEFRAYKDRMQEVRRSA